MKNQSLFTVIIITAIITALVTYLICRPIDDLSPVKKVETIAAETETKAAPVETSIAKWEGEKQLIRDSVAGFKAKWMAAVFEKGKIKEQLKEISKRGVAKHDTPNYPEIPDVSNGTAEDYLNTDSLCAETIGAMERQALKNDSLLQAHKFLSAVYKLGFNQMKEAAQTRDAQIKQLNKKLRWQKVQATTLKVAAIAAAAIVIKNQLK